MAHFLDNAPHSPALTSLTRPLSPNEASETSTDSYAPHLASPAPSPSESLGPMTPANALLRIGFSKTSSHASNTGPCPLAPESSSGSSDGPSSAAATVVGVQTSSHTSHSAEKPPADIDMDDMERLPPLDPSALPHMPDVSFPMAPRQSPQLPTAFGRHGLSPRHGPAPDHSKSPRFYLHTPPQGPALAPAMSASAPSHLMSEDAPLKSQLPPSPMLTSCTGAATPTLSEPDLIQTQDGRMEVIPSEGPLVGPRVDTLRALASGSDARAAAVRTKYARQKRESIAQGREDRGNYLSLTEDQKTALFSSIGKAQKRTLSDANKLPLSTGRRGIPRPIPTLEELQIIHDEVRRRDQWRQYGLINDEPESDSGNRRPSLKPAKGKMLRAIPCLFVSDIKLALPFWREILGFVNVTKPENYMAMLCRTPTNKSILRGGEEGVQIMLRTSFGSYGVASDGPSSADSPARPAPMALWIEVENVDELFDEVYAKCRKTDPVEESYFPPLPFGKARLLDRPQNTPFGTREMRVNDPDANLLIFFQEMRPEPPLPTDTKVRGPVIRPRVRGRGRR